MFYFRFTRMDARTFVVHAAIHVVVRLGWWEKEGHSGGTTQRRTRACADGDWNIFVLHEYRLEKQPEIAPTNIG